MRPRQSWVGASAVVMMMSLCACGWGTNTSQGQATMSEEPTGSPVPDAPADSPAPEAPSGEGTDRSARTLPIPGRSRDGGQQLPEGHPPIAEGAPSAVPEDGVRLTWATPDGWVAETPSSPMRRAQYRVPGPGGDGQCVVFYFGAGQGGDPQANAVRWAGQFKQPGGRSSLEVMKTTELSGAQTRVLLVEVTGTYSGGMTMTMEPAEEQPGYMLLGGIAEGPDAPWFFKLTGPEATIRSQRGAFLAMLESVRGGS